MVELDTDTRFPSRVMQLMSVAGLACTLLVGPLQSFTLSLSLSLFSLFPKLLVWLPLQSLAVKKQNVQILGGEKLLKFVEIGGLQRGV